MIKVIFVWILSLIMISCDPTEPVILPETMPMETMINGQVFINQFDEDLLKGSECENIQNCMSGTGRSNATMFEDFAVECHSSLTITNTNFNDQINFDKGEFRFLDDKNNVIYGEYQGCGTYCENLFEAELIFKIIGGEGYFKEATGEIKVKIKTFSTQPSILMMEFNGTVYHEVPKQSII